jgi:hypothetical protein
VDLSHLSGKNKDAAKVGHPRRWCARRLGGSEQGRIWAAVEAGYSFVEAGYSFVEANYSFGLYSWPVMANWMTRAVESSSSREEIIRS